VGGDAKSVACRIHRRVEGCTISYNIDKHEKSPPRAIGLLDLEVLSIAVFCSCGDELYACNVNGTLRSTERVSKFLGYLLNRAPVGCRVESLCFWQRMHDISLRGQDKGPIPRIEDRRLRKTTYGSTINIPRTYNVGLLIYTARAS
jgi:hypothetical protein